MKIVINADDFGKNPSVNEAISYAFDKGIINQTTAMATEVSFVDAMNIASKKGFIDKVGLHINLDEGYPLTDNIKNISDFCNSDGSFNRRFRQSIIKSSFFIDKTIKSCCVDELCAQMMRYLDNGGQLMHLDSHHHVHFKKSILDLLIPLARDMKFRSMRICPYYQKDGLIKTIYKKHINKIIRQNFNTVDCFVGSYKDYQLLKVNQLLPSSFEVMLHPDIINGKYVDVLKKDLQFVDLLNIKIL